MSSADSISNMRNSKDKATAQSLLSDDRFAELFKHSDFQVDEDSHEFKLLHPTLVRCQH